MSCSTNSIPQNLYAEALLQVYQNMSVFGNKDFKVAVIDNEAVKVDLNLN